MKRTSPAFAPVAEAATAAGTTPWDAIRPWARWVLAGGSGAIAVTAFPPWNWAPLAFVVLVPFMVLLRGAPPQRALVLGLTWGIAFFLGSVYWVTHVMVTYGNMPLPWAVLSCLGLTLVLAGFPALFGWALARLGWLGPGAWTLAAAALWVAVELLRTHLFTGFPWVLLGYSQGVVLEMIQVARFTGVYGVSFLVALVNAALAAALACAGARPWRRAAPAALALLAVAGTVAYGRAVLRAPLPPGDVTVAVIQGNVDQGVKWTPGARTATVALYGALTRAVAPQRPALVVWPESAMPFPIRFDPALGPPVLEIARAAGVPILVGSIDRVRPTQFANSAFLVTEEGRIAAKYDKRHLVPFGEYVPLKPVLGFLDQLVRGIGDFVPGETNTIFRGPFGRFVVSICYEIVFPDETRQAVRDGAEYLVNITNDAWFGHTSAPHQHLGMAAFRAVENDVYVVRAANTGISAIIEPSGRIVHATGLYTEAAFVARIGRRAGHTFYTRHGDVFAWACGAAALAMLAAGWRRARRR